MSLGPNMAVIPVRDQELIALLRDDSLRSVVEALRGADPTYRVLDDGPVLGSAGLRVGRRSWRATVRALDLGGREGGFPRVAAAVQEAAWARGWTETPCRHALRLPRGGSKLQECETHCLRTAALEACGPDGAVCPPPPAGTPVCLVARA